MKNIDLLVLSHPDDDHLSVLRVPHHCSSPNVANLNRLMVHVDTDTDTPPRAAEYLLRLLPKKNREYLLGDLEEEFRTIMLPKYGMFGARLYYWVHTVKEVAPISCRLVKTIPFVAAIFKLLSIIWGLLR